MSEYREYVYYLEDAATMPQVSVRRTKPRIGQVITSHGRKWEVYYVETGPTGTFARCEPKPERINR